MKNENWKREKNKKEERKGKGNKARKFKESKDNKGKQRGNTLCNKENSTGKKSGSW